MATGKKYYQLIPEKVLQDFDVINDLIKPGIKGYSADYLKEVISIVANNIGKEKGPAPISMAYINKLVPQGQWYLTGLIKWEIIKRSGQFIPGQACYRYEFAFRYYSKYIHLTLNNAKLIRRIKTVWEEVRKKSAKSIRTHSEQTKYLKQLTIEENYIWFIESNYSIETDQYNSILSSASRILNGDTSNCSIDSTSGRFHSIITNMSKGLRPYLRIKGEPLVTIDIKNSQPYLSTIILTNPSKVSNMTKNPAFTLLLQSLKYKDNEDVKKYIYLVASGQLYEYLMQEFAKGGLPLTRKETKGQVLRILFARNRMPRNPINDTEELISKLTGKEKRKREEFIKDFPKIKKTREIFIKNFPTVHRIFSKVRGHEQGDKFQNFKRFAILLQRIESYLMLDIILKRIYKELPGTIAVTIHDSIMTGILTNNIEAVRKIMIEELTFFIGLAPQIEIERIIEENKGEEVKQTISNHYVITTLISCN